MLRFISIFFFALSVINVCEAILPPGKECPTEALIPSKSNRPEAALESTEDDELECPCVEQLCISLCCPVGSLMTRPGNCTPINNGSLLELPPYYDSQTLEVQPEKLQIQDFHIFSWTTPCEDNGVMVQLKPEERREHQYMLLANGSIVLAGYEMTINFLDYCLGAVNGTSVYSVVVCYPDDYEEDSYEINTVDSVIQLIEVYAAIVSVPFFVATFAVYTIVPQLKNIHGATLRGYVGMSIVSYTFLGINSFSEYETGSNMCIIVAFMISFGNLASAFWLNVMCFDIWWTFSSIVVLSCAGYIIVRCIIGFFTWSHRIDPVTESVGVDVRQCQRKKFLIYSAYAWGIPLLISWVGLIMDSVPNLPRSVIRPEFKKSCWFHTYAAEAIYHFIPMGLTVVCNIYFFLSTAMKIKRHKRDTARHLKGVDSRRHDENNQRFSIHLKLFVLMATNWSMDVICWLCDDEPKYLWAIADTINNLQGVIIFIVFVWKPKIRQLLLERLGRRDPSTATAAAATPLQEKSNPFGESPKASTNESECV